MGSGFSSLSQPLMKEAKIIVRKKRELALNQIAVPAAPNMKGVVGRKNVMRTKPSSVPCDVWLDVFSFLCRDRLDTASISCNIFRTVIGKHLANRCLRHLEKVHIRPYDTCAYILIAKIVSAHGSTKYTDANDDIADFLLTTLKNCYIETFLLEYTHWLPALMPVLAHNLDKSVHVGKLHFANSHLHELPTVDFRDFFNRLASIVAVRFDDALAAEQLSNELLAICYKKGVKELRCTPIAPYYSLRTSWDSLHKLNEDGIIAFLFGDSERTTPTSLSVGYVALGPHFINRLVEIHESAGIRANISLDVTQQFYHFDVSRWERNIKSVPSEGGAVFDFPGPMRLQVAVIDDLLRIRRGSAKSNDGFFLAF